MQSSPVTAARADFSETPLTAEGIALPAKTSSRFAAIGGVIAQLGNLGFKCKFIPNEQTLLWGKLSFLAPFALTTSASGMNLGEALANTDWKPKLFSAIAETCAVGNASGAQLDAQRVQAGFETAPPAMRSSMQKDVAARRPLELDSIGGPIVRGGERYGIDVSTTLQLMGAIRSKTRAA